MLFTDKKAGERVEKLLCEATAWLKDGRLHEFLGFMTRLKGNFSIGNKLLIWVQMPSATHVAGKGQWESDGRNVVDERCSISLMSADFTRTEGDKPLTFYKVVNVYDISQTSGKPVAARIPEFIGVEEMRLLLRWFALDLGCHIIGINEKLDGRVYHITLECLKQLFVFEGCREFEFHAAAYMFGRRYGIDQPNQAYRSERQFESLVKTQDLKEHLEMASTLYRRMEEAFGKYVSFGLNTVAIEHLRKVS